MISVRDDEAETAFFNTTPAALSNILVGVFQIFLLTALNLSCAGGKEDYKDLGHYGGGL